MGKYKMEIGLELRQAMLLNGVLFNSEAWHNVTEKEMKRLEEVDEYLLRDSSRISVSRKWGHTDQTYCGQ